VRGPTGGIEETSFWRDKRITQNQDNAHKLNIMWKKQISAALEANN